MRRPQAEPPMPVEAKNRQFDSSADGRRLKGLIPKDGHSHLWLAIRACRENWPGHRWGGGLIRRRRPPELIRLPNQPALHRPGFTERNGASTTTSTAWLKTKVSGEDGSAVSPDRPRSNDIVHLRDAFLNSAPFTTNRETQILTRHWPWTATSHAPASPPGANAPGGRSTENSQTMRLGLPPTLKRPGPGPIAEVTPRPQPRQKRKLVLTKAPN